jgi:ATP-dependent DNA helicase RecG
MGEIEISEAVFRRRRSLLVRFSDGTGSMTMRMFYFSNSQKRTLTKGRWLQCYGEVRRGPATLEMIHPEYRVSDERPSQPMDKSLTPVYPSTEGIGQALWRNLSSQVLDKYLDGVVELLPDVLLKEFHLAKLGDSLVKIHRPPAGVDLEKVADVSNVARQRLVFEELLAHHLGLRQVRERRAEDIATALPESHDVLEKFVSGLPFTLTGAQKHVLKEVSANLAIAAPMVRLVQGDVGSGKTVVAAGAMLQAWASGGQSALMAPTELLAEQHFTTLGNWFEPLGIRVGWLSGKTPLPEKRQTLSELLSGDLMVVVGTHALFQQDVGFDNLCLVVIDEQHRFGVDQRLALRNKRSDGGIPHQLIMTATPIPRTLAMGFYADIDVSSIDELPPGRTPADTVVIPDSRRPEVIKRVHEACRNGQQVYWVCPLIEESDVLAAQAATETQIYLRETLDDVSVGLVHGRMKSAEKDAVMQDFRAAKMNLLVATTVIEVGVDVPNASLMIIENAERLGLSQLHQLRGRVGRGNTRSACVLMYKAPLGKLARVRLATLRETSDGFRIAEIDLEMRGPGDMLGTRQTGDLNMRIANLVRDQHWLPHIEKAGTSMLKEHADAVEPLIRRWIGDREIYGSV